MAVSSVKSPKRITSGSRFSQTRKTAKKGPVSNRTTVALSSEAAEIVERFREATGLSISEAISELIERSEPRPPRIKYVDGLPMADIPMDGKWITTEDILRAQAELG
jgi:hypothetical protein